MVKVASAAAASQAVINISADPGNYSALNASCRTANNLIAANDWVVYQAADGTYIVDTVASVSTLAITMTTNCPTGGVLAGAPFWWFGIETDTNPNNGLVHPRFNALANTQLILGRMDGLTTIPDLGGGIQLGNGAWQPCVIVADNVTAAGFLENVGVEFDRKAVA